MLRHWRKSPGEAQSINYGNNPVANWELYRQRRHHPRKPTYKENCGCGRDNVCIRIPNAIRYSQFSPPSFAFSIHICSPCECVIRSDLGLCIDFCGYSNSIQSVRNGDVGSKRAPFKLCVNRAKTSCTHTVQVQVKCSPHERRAQPVHSVTG